MRKAIPAAQLTEMDAHINDQAFADAVLAKLDAWIAQGVVKV